MRPFLTVWGAWLLVMAGANLATALYALYARQFHFSSLVLTTIFATYAVVLVPALIVFGRLSDRLGRRAVVVLGLVTAIAGLAVFAAAQGEVWLYAARALQGLAVGMISGAATAALVELDPEDDRRRASLFAGLAQSGGSAAGPLLAGVLVQWGPAPRQLSYLVVLAATIAAAALMLRLPEPAAGMREPWRIQVPRVPRELLASFLRVSVTAGLVWGALALFLSVVPTYAVTCSTRETSRCCRLSRRCRSSRRARRRSRLGHSSLRARHHRPSGSRCSRSASCCSSPRHRRIRSHCSRSDLSQQVPVTVSRSSTRSRS